MAGRFRTLSGALVGLLLLPVGGVWGQVDHRINRGRAMGTGRLLDRNPGLAAGGINQPARRFDLGLRANAIVSGNVTGLAGFQGLSPVPYHNQFRVGLPSAGLSGFQSRSVGVNELRPNRVLAPAYYFAPEKTIADVGQIRRGLNAPGTSKLKSPNAEPLRVASPKQPSTGLLVPDAVDLRVGRDGFSTAFDVFRRKRAAQVRADPLAVLRSPFGEAARSSIFGMPTPPAPAVVSPLSSPVLPEAGLAPRFAEDGSLLPGEAEGLGERGLGDGTGLAGSRPPQSGLTPRPAATPDEASRFGIRRRGGEAVGGGQGQRAADRGPPGLGADPFDILYEAVRELKASGVEQLGFQLARPAEADATGAVGGQVTFTPEPTAVAGSQGALQRSDQAVAALATAAKWARDRLEDPVTSFVGHYEGRFNDIMAAGETALHEGRFYDAARHYDLARLLNPSSPLPLFGRGHALAAAGDYATAAWLLQKGIERFPQIAVFRLDLLALVGQQDVYDIRRKDLEGRLARSEDYELRFLLGYLELYSGLPEDGLADLQRAAKSAPEGSIISVFPDLVLGRRSLPPLRD